VPDADADGFCVPVPVCGRVAVRVADADADADGFCVAVCVSVPVCLDVIPGTSVTQTGRTSTSALPGLGVHGGRD
jgi:hypothetical protein